MITLEDVRENSLKTFLNLEETIQHLHRTCRYFKPLIISDYDIRRWDVKEVEPLAEEIREKFEVHGHAFGLTTVYTGAINVEEKKSYVEDIKQTRERLQKVKASSYKDFFEKMERYDVLDEGIQTMELASSRIFLTEHDASEFASEKGIKFSTLDHTTVLPILRFTGHWDNYLEFLEQKGTPNIELYKNLKEDVKRNFRREDTDFNTYAPTYLITDREEAIDEVFSLMAGNDASLRGRMFRVGNLGFLDTPEFNKKAKELGIDKKTLQILFEVGGEKYHSNGDLHHVRRFLIEYSDNFHQRKLQSDNPDYQWSATRALIERSKHILGEPSFYSYEINGKKAEKYREEHQKRDTKFFEKDLPKIIKALELEKDFPELASKPTLLGRRFRDPDLWHYDSAKAYGLPELEASFEKFRELRPYFKLMNIELNTANFLHRRNNEFLPESLDLLLETFTTSDLSSPYFKQAFNQNEIRNGFFRNSNRNPVNWVSQTKEIVDKLNSLSESRKEVADSIADVVLNRYRFDDDYLLEFLDRVEIFEPKPEQIPEMLNAFKDYFHTLENNRELKSENLDKFRMYQRIQVASTFVDSVTNELVTQHLLPLSQDIDTIEQIFENGYIPTKHLIERLKFAKSKETEINHWKNTDERITRGEFSEGNELHLSLEYRRFLQHSDNLGLRTAFSTFTNLFNNTPRNLEQKELEEIDYMCIEAEHLIRMLRERQEIANQSGRGIMVVGNLTYGTIAMLPVENILISDGIDFTKTKIGSTPCHANPYYMKHRLFTPEVQRRMLTEQPDVFVVDGTAHLTDYHKGARYPDAHQGYINQLLLMNNFLTGEMRNQDGFRPEGHVERLRVEEDFRKELAYLQFTQDMSAQQMEGYKVSFWNPANIPMKIRSERELVGIPQSGRFEKGPQFCITNVTMPHEAISHDAVKGHKRHQPAYFDDTTIARHITAEVTPIGVNYTNILKDIARERFKVLHPTL